MKNIIILILILGAGFIVLQYLPASPESATDALPATDSALGEPVTAIAGAQMVPYFDATEEYIAVPEGEGPFPALVLIHEWWGLNDNIKSLADDFAEQGYVALAVDLYHDGIAGIDETT